MTATLKATLVETIDVKNTLGEGVLWRVSDQTLWWTDIQERTLYALEWRSMKITTYATPERVGSFGFIETRDDILIVAFESGFALYQPESAALHWLARPEELGDGVRLNDGRVDPFGRFWAGSMVERDLSEGETPDGRLYMLDADGVAHSRARGTHISNGLCWSPGGDRIYFADSMRNSVRTAPFSENASDDLAFELFAKTTDGSPDGAVTDREGRYWSALWGAGRVACFSTAGEEIFTRAVDAPQPTCPAFGGPEGNLLFVTTAREGLSESALSASSKSGSIFVYETNTGAAPAARAKLAEGLVGAAFS